MASKSCCKEEEIIVNNDGITVLDESQDDRDNELAKIMQVHCQEIKSIDMFQVSNIQIFDGDEIPKTEEQYKDLYVDYENLNLLGYLKLLMFTSVNRRGKDLKRKLDLANGRCLDFGSGVGTHSIHMMQRGNKVTILDIPGELLDFTLKRIYNRKCSFNFECIIFNSILLSESFYDYVNCLDVLEHCYNPLDELKNIHKSIKMDGLLHLQVSEMVKPSSGHFKRSIDIWKTQGKDFLCSYFKEEQKNIYRKFK